MVMTNYCLTIGPLPRSIAEAAASLIEATPDAKPLALSIADREERGWEMQAHYGCMAGAARAASVLRAMAIAEPAIAIAPLPDIDWVKRSLEGLPPVTVGQFFVRGSHHRALGPQRSTSIEIDAGTAFGTGHHATTQGCLLALDRLLKHGEPRRALDIGCGSGILAIAFARATRRPALATDIDPEAVHVTADNARRNGVGGLVRAVLASGAACPAVGAQAPFDIIFANILARPLVTLAPRIGRLAVKGGVVVLSGLYGDQRRWVEASYRLAGFRPSFRLCFEDWSTLVLTR